MAAPGVQPVLPLVLGTLGRTPGLLVNIAAWCSGPGKEPICFSTGDFLHTTEGCGMHDVPNITRIATIQVPRGQCKLKTASSHGPNFDLALSTRLISELLQQVQVLAHNSFQDRVFAELQLMEPLGLTLELIAKLYAGGIMSSPAHMLQPAYTNFCTLQKVIMQGAQPGNLLDFRTIATSAEPSSSIGQLPTLAPAPTHKEEREGVSMLKTMGLATAVTVLMATGIYPWGPIIVGLVRKQLRKRRQRKMSAEAAAQEAEAKQTAQEPATRVWPAETASQKAIRQDKNRQQATARRMASQTSNPQRPTQTTSNASPEGRQQAALVIHPDGEACQLAVTGSAAGEAAGAEDDEGLEALRNVGRFALVVVALITGVIPWGYIVFKGAQKFAHILVPQSGLSKDASRWLEEAAFPVTLTEALQAPAHQLSPKPCALGKGLQSCKPPTEAMRWLEEAGCPPALMQAAQEQAWQPPMEVLVAEAEHLAEPTEAMQQEAGPMPVAGAITDETVTPEPLPITEANRWLAELGEPSMSLAAVKELCTVSPGQQGQKRKSWFFGLF